MPGCRVASRSRSRGGSGAQLPLLAVALCAALSSPACAPRERAGERAPNLLLIVVDSLRADRLGAYGAARDTSPAIDALAQEGLVFERAYSTSSWTQPSVASLLTGRFPSAHGLQQIGDTLGEGLPTLAALLAERGFGTAGVVSHLLLGQRFGFARGFARFDESEARGHEHVSTPGVTQHAIEALRTLHAGGQPFFVFVHYFDPHYSYVDHEDIAFAKPGTAARGRLRGGETINDIANLLPTLTKPELRTLRAFYDEEIRATDDGVAKLLAELERLGAAENTVVVFTADHGEEFVDHGYVGHTYTLYEEIVRVPLLLRVPAGLALGGKPAPPPGTRIASPVSLAGLAPFLLQLAGGDASALEAQDDSIERAWAAVGPGGAAQARRPHVVLSEVDYIDWSPAGASRASVASGTHTRKRALVSGDWKLVRDETSGAVELYDLARDPHEQRNRASEDPKRARELAQALDREVARVRAADASGSPIDVSPDEAAALRALGYAAP